MNPPRYPQSEVEWRLAAAAAQATLQIHRASRAGVDHARIHPQRRRLALDILRRAARQGIFPDPIHVFELVRATVTR